MFLNSQDNHSADNFFMRRCIQLAANGEGLTWPNPMVGAVVVYDGRIIGEGWHHKAGEPHAEPNAIHSVKDQTLLCKSTLYVSLEPCSHYGKTPPCADLIIEKRIPRVVIGCADPFPSVCGRGIEKLRSAGIEVSVGVEQEECLLLNRRFFTFHKLQRPYIVIKWAQTEDGFIDHLRTSPSEAPLKLSDGYTSLLVHKLRAQSQCIMVGSRTQYLDSPRLTVRNWPLYGTRQPEKAVMSRSLGDLKTYLHALYEKNVQSILVEGGSSLIDSFTGQDLWDELQVETAPLAIGQGHSAPKMPDTDGCRTFTLKTTGNHTITSFVRIP